MTIGYIYKIVCLDPLITDTYVGSCTVLAKRKCEHKSACNNSNDKRYNYNIYSFIRAHGNWPNWTMLAIEQVEYTIKHELLVRERFHLENLKASLNKAVPSRTHQESVKAYRDEHRTELNESAKQIINCDCGKISNKCHISRHNKSRRHQNYLSGLPQVVPSEIARTEESIS
jgi:hypothetical protein